MPYSLVLERASGTHNYSVQRKVEPTHLRVLCSVPVSQAHSNKFRFTALEALCFISLWCLGAQRKGMVIIMKQKEHIVSLKKRIEKSPECKLNPPLSEETISELEHRFQFRLPEEYRLFLLLAGNGGQISSITHDCDEFLPFPTDIINQRESLEKLRQPFVFKDSCVW